VSFLGEGFTNCGKIWLFLQGFIKCISLHFFGSQNQSISQFYSQLSFTGIKNDALLSTAWRIFLYFT